MFYFRRNCFSEGDGVYQKTLLKYFKPILVFDIALFVLSRFAKLEIT